MNDATTISAREAWKAVVMETDPRQFAQFFSTDASLTASVLESALHGPDKIYRYFEATRMMFERFAFNSETIDGDKTFMTWEGEAFGQVLKGVTVIRRDSTGLIAAIDIFSGPLSALTPFSAGLVQRLTDTR